MDTRLSDEQLFLLYLVKYDRPRHLRDRQNPFEKFDDGHRVELIGPVSSMHPVAPNTTNYPSTFPPIPPQTVPPIQEYFLFPR